MTAKPNWIALICGVLLPLPLLAQATAPTRPFAAPEAAASLPAGSASGIGQVTLALLIVLVAIFGVALVVRRLRGITRGGAGGIEVLAQVALGARERAMIVKVGQMQLLLGVAPGRVSMLQVLPPDATLPTDGGLPTQPGERPTFASLLRKSLGK
ncbi:MAG: flagellar biosynthetic protein FliO [Pseudomonadota bacterium]